MVILILIIFFWPDNVVRIILGLPFVLFAPGYTLIAALFPRKSSLDGIQRLALSFGLSIVVIPLIGLILNYTSGITTNSIIVSVTSCIVTMSAIAWFKLRKLPDSEQVIIIVPRFSWKERSHSDKTLSIILVFVILGAMGTAIYTVAIPKTGELFTEFYILDSYGTAENYSITINLGDTSNVTLGIVNYEGVETTYHAEVKIDKALNNTIGPFTLQPEEKYENIVNLKPQKAGDNQKVEFLLFKNGQIDAYRELHFFVDVR
jgi:uncharacterized membrane protein